MKKCLTAIAAALITFSLPAQIISYNLATIPEAVKKDANVVKRYEDIFFEVTDIDKAFIKKLQVYTILNVDGREELFFREKTSRFRALGDVDIKVFDSTGKQIMRYKKKDLASVAYSDGLIDDDKHYYIDIPANSFPVTVSYEYEIRYKGTLFYPNYEILAPEQGVETSTFTAKVPKNLDLRYKEKNISLKPQLTEDEKYKYYKWSVKNLAPLKFEEHTVDYREIYPSVMLAPNRFSMDDYEGDMSSWKNFGYWYASLKKGIDVLPENKKAFFKQMISHAATDREKVKILYEYLQKNFRYVSIQLGIGGYKPFPAAFTDDKKYGDCKGLSNYMQAALDAVGIKSYQALIFRAPNGVPLDPAFPCNLFNHVILMVPDKKDTIWLECTSKTLDFGMLDISTENRNALVITENGGALVSTPATQFNENVFAVRTVVDLQATGEGKTSTLFTTAGEYKDLVNEVLNEKTDDQKEFIVHYWGFKQPDEFVLSKKEDNGHLAGLDMVVEKVPEFTAGNKMFIGARLYKMWPRKLPEYASRKQDYYFPHPFIKTDTTIFKLPAGSTVDVLPKEKNLQCKYASYKTKYWYNETEKAVYSTASLVLQQHRIPAAHYADIKKFFDDVLMDDTQKIVVLKP